MLNFSWNLLFQIFQNLNIKEAPTSHEFKFVLGTYLVLQQGTSKNLWVFLSWLMLSFFFSTQFQKWKLFVNFIRLILLLTCKNLWSYWIPMTAVSGKKINQSINKETNKQTNKQKHYKDRRFKLYFSKGIQNNRPMSIWVGAFSMVMQNIL